MGEGYILRLLHESRVKTYVLILKNKKNLLRRYLAVGLLKPPDGNESNELNESDALRFYSETGRTL